MKRALVALVLLLCVVLPAHADSGTLLRSFPAAHVFAARVQIADAGDYHDYRYVSAAGSVCDVSRPEGIWVCGVDLPVLVARYDIPVTEYIPLLPASVHWDAWNWDTMSFEFGGYTAVDLVLEVRSYDVVQNVAEYRFVACSRVPDAPDQAACYIEDRIDHFNYVLVSWSDLGPLVQAGALP